MDENGKRPEVCVRGALPGVDMIGDLVDVVGYAGELPEEPGKLSGWPGAELAVHDKLPNMGAGREAGYIALLTKLLMLRFV